LIIVNAQGALMKNNLKIIIVIAVVAIMIVAGVLISGILTPSNSNTIKYTDVPPRDQQAFIQQGKIDGGVSWEPFCSDSIIAGTGHAIINSSQIWPNHPCCVIVVDNNYLLNNPDTIEAMLKAHIEANRWIANAIANKNTTEGQANYTLLLNLGASFSNRTTEVVAASLQNMKLTYNITNQALGYFEQFTDSYIESGLIKNESLSNRGFSSVDAFINDFVNTSYLEAADSVQPVDPGTPLKTVRVGYLNGDLHQFSRVVAESNLTLGTGKSLFETYGIQTEIPSGMPAAGFAVGGAVMNAFAIGDNIDVGYLGAPPAILNQMNNLQLNVRIVSLVNTEGSALIVKNSVTSINDLGGLVIGQPGLSSIQYLMLLEIGKRYNYTVSKA
jgi:ABC-type nitrate/sulfonate/bicarbonate transport system substrate-binding protein